MKHISAISEFHKLLDLPAPLHPLISLVDVTQMHITENDIWKKFTLDFYSISLKRNVTAKVKYGQQYYDFDKGTMNFLAPKQIQSLEVDEVNEISQNCGLGYMLMIHPDFLYNHSLGSQIKNYGFFSYSLNEALHLSDKEEANIIEIFQKIEHEYQFIDRHTQDIILSQLDLLLNYSNRFYERQFITRKAVNNDLLSKTEQVLMDYFDTGKMLVQGVPTVEFLASQLHLSPSYLSDMLRSLTGQSAKQHIHNTLIDKAKEYLSTTTLSVAEIAYQLGFEYPQSFNKLFKKKTDMSPLAFRANFN